MHHAAPIFQAVRHSPRLLVPDHPSHQLVSLFIVAFLVPLPAPEQWFPAGCAKARFAFFPLFIHNSASCFSQSRTTAYAIE
jgi:hypothetical protein